LPKLKPSEEIFANRAKEDCIFYYDDFKKMLIENMKSGDANAGQDLARLNRWLISYQNFAKQWHTAHGIVWRDSFEREEDADRVIGNSSARPRAPFIPAFDEIIKY
jgi:hypothetical protein